MLRPPHALDKPLLWTTLLLLAAGILIVASASMGVAEKNFGTISYYAIRHLVYALAGGVGAFLITQAIYYRRWRELAIPLMLGSFVLLALVFFPELSYTAGGARRWLRLGPLSFQPSEPLKLAFVIYLAAWLDARRKEIASVAYGAAPFALMIGTVSVFLIMQKDIGTLAVLVGGAGLLYLIGGGKLSQALGFVMLGVILAYITIQIEPYRWDRISVFLNSGSDPHGAGYQINQALIAIGSGGFFGLGFGKSVQKFNFLPEPMGDSIFAILAEETGFLGALIVISLFAFLLWRGMKIARRAPDTFGKLLAAGVTLIIIIQAFVNMGAISGLLPLTGIPLPLVSYGGTALVTTMAGLGILANISKYT